MKRRIAFWTGLALCAAGLPAWAETVFTPPEGCRLEMTVQLASCSITQYYRCDADPKGHQRAAVVDAAGEVVHLSYIDAETRWLETRDPRRDLIEVIATEADPASLTALMKTGRDDYDFTTEDNSGLVVRHQGYDRLIGEEAEIDGVRLQITEFDIFGTIVDGEFFYSRSGRQYVSPDHGRFYGGIEDWGDWTGAKGRGNDSPVRFLLPEDSGFGGMQPLFGCDMNIAGLVYAPIAAAITQ